MNEWISVKDRLPSRGAIVPKTKEMHKRKK